MLAALTIHENRQGPLQKRGSSSNAGSLG